jgi:hypothetical protein
MRFGFGHKNMKQYRKDNTNRTNDVNHELLGIEIELIYR